jgi:hypothetical protein
MNSSINGDCALCRDTCELRDSHFLPKALYRLVRANGKRNPHPVRLNATGRQQTAFQARSYLLCGKCEKRFDENGENWVMRHCYRGRGVFRLRALVEQAQPSFSEREFSVYSTAALQDIKSEQLAYFCASVVWRASVRDWCVEGYNHEAIKLGPYQDEIRRYLLNETGFPRSATINVVLSRLRTPALTFSFVDTARVDEGHCHRLSIPGITFMLTVGKRAVEDSAICLMHSPEHPIFISTAGDERVQREVLRLMGKVAPRWGSYPLVEGFESKAE